MKSIKMTAQVTLLYLKISPPPPPPPKKDNQDFENYLQQNDRLPITYLKKMTSPLEQST